MKQRFIQAMHFQGGVYKSLGLSGRVSDLGDFFGDVLWGLALGEGLIVETSSSDTESGGVEPSDDGWIWLNSTKISRAIKARMGEV